MNSLNSDTQCNSKMCILKHVEEVEDLSSTPMGCNAMYVRDVEDGWNYIVYVILFMSEMSKI